MVKEILAIIRILLRIIVIAHVLLLALVIMIPREESINIAKHGYPPFTSSDVQVVEQVQHEKGSNKFSNSDLALAQWDLKLALIVNTVVMMILFFIVLSVVHNIIGSAMVEEALEEWEDKYR